MVVLITVCIIADICPDYECYFQESGQESLCQLRYWMDMYFAICWVIRIKHQLPHCWVVRWRLFFSPAFPVSEPWLLVAAAGWRARGCSKVPSVGPKATGCHLNPPWANPFPVLTTILACDEQQLFFGFLIVWCFFLQNKNWYCVILSYYYFFFLVSSSKNPYLSKKNLKCKLQTFLTCVCMFGRIQVQKEGREKMDEDATEGIARWRSLFNLCSCFVLAVFTFVWIILSK